ncbi:hypothetical protein ACRRTK_008748 [Alexandromys fortis]
MLMERTGSSSRAGSYPIAVHQAALLHFAAQVWENAQEGCGQGKQQIGRGFQTS